MIDLTKASVPKLSVVVPRLRLVAGPFPLHMTMQGCGGRVPEVRYE